VRRGAGVVSSAAVALLVLAGCSPTLDVGEETPLALDEEVFDDPDPETAGTEEPATDGDGGVAVQLPGLPIGGSARAVSATLQCAEVNWSGPPDLLDGIEMEITEVAFEPAGVYVLSGKPCPGPEPPCLPRWLGEEVCTVAVAWTGAPSDVDGALFFTSGRVTCSPEVREACLAFERDLAATDRRGIDLLPPPDASGGPDGDGGAHADGSDDGSDAGRTRARTTSRTRAWGPTGARTVARMTAGPPATVSTGRAGEHRRSGARRWAPRALVRRRHHVRRARDLPQRPAVLLRVRELAGAVPGVRYRHRHPRARDPGLRDAQPAGAAGAAAGRGARRGAGPPVPPRRP
jgi:hypothetical protein